jgi:hypothetical protein
MGVVVVELRQMRVRLRVVLAAAVRVLAHREMLLLVLQILAAVVVVHMVVLAAQAAAA